jgi:hypothetical protein
MQAQKKDQWAEEQADSKGADSHPTQAQKKNQ